MKITEADARIALNALSNIGPANFHHLLVRFGSAAAALEADAGALEETSGIGPKAARPDNRVRRPKNRRARTCRRRKTGDNHRHAVG